MSLFKELHPDLTQELNQEYLIQNNMDIESITPFSNRRALWVCKKCGGNYFSTFASRSAGRGCPYCSGKRVLPGYNDLKSKFPVIAAEWDYEKNYPNGPDQVTPFSSKRVFWRCSLGHSFDMPISARTSQNQGCPYCGGKRVLKGFNDLASKYPVLLEDWDYEKNAIKPDEITFGSAKKAYWKCHICGHEWAASVNTRTSGEGCRICGNKRGAEKRVRTIVEKGHSLKDMAPELLKEWDYEKNSFLPEEVAYTSSKRAYWICPKGHSYDLCISDKYAQHQGCPYCAGKRVLKGFNDLESVYPDLIVDWDYDSNEMQPDEITFGSHKKVYWKCRNCGKSYARVIGEQKRRSLKVCPDCFKEIGSSVSEQIVYYYVQKAFPDAVNNYSDRKTLGNMKLDVYIPSERIGIEYDGQAWHNDQKRDLAKAKILNNLGIKLIRFREGRLNDIDDGSTVISVPRRDTESDYLYLTKPLTELLDLLKVYHPVEIPVIDIEHDTPAVLTSFLVTHKEKSLAKYFPKIAKELHPDKNGGIKAENIYSGTGQQFWWKCSKCGHVWKARVSDRTGKGLGCRICKNKEGAQNRLARKREYEGSFAENFPDLLKEWDFKKNQEIDPQEIVNGSHYKVWWKCSSCGHEWKCAVAERTRGKKGCQKCGYKRATEKQIKTRLALVGSLAEAYPYLIKEWDFDKNYPLTPESVTPHSNRTVWWKCPTCGKEWQTRISTRTRDDGKGTNCPECYKAGRIKGQIMMDLQGD